MFLMSDEEILYKCRINGATKHYINVLADLNLCTTNEIERLLKSNGWVKQGKKFIPPKQSFPPTQFVQRVFEPGSFKGSVMEQSYYCINIEQEVKRRRKTTAPGKLEQALISYIKEHYSEGITFLEVAETFGCPLWLVTDVVYKNDVINGSIINRSDPDATNAYVLQSIVNNLLKRIVN